MINFWSFWTIQGFVKVSPIFLGKNPFPSYPSDRHTLTNYSWGNALKSSVYTVYTKDEYMRQEAVCHYSFAQMESLFIRL